MSSPRITIPGSDRREIVSLLSPPALSPTERLEVTARFKKDEMNQDKINLLLDFCDDYNLYPVEFDADQGLIKIAGSVDNMEKAFGVKLVAIEHLTGSHRGHFGPISVPANLDFVEGVFGLDDRPIAKPHYRKLNPSLSQPAGSFTPPQVAEAYSFPTGVNGSGQTVAIIELGGGFKPSQMNQYFKSIGVPVPSIGYIGVDGGRNQTGSPDGADGEVQLDIQIVGAIASGAKIVVYFCPNTDRGFMDGVSAAIHDKHNNPSIISISWGGPESTYTEMALKSFDGIFAQAVAKNISVFVASGDDGSDDGVGDGGLHVDFPGSSPNVTACGGTRLSVSGSIGTEVAWGELSQGDGASGGGYSTAFTVPVYQSGVTKNPSRGVPDVSGNAAPDTGYNVIIDGQSNVIGGTSAVAPLWAALTALMNQSAGKNLGFLNPILYKNAGSFNDITSGSNGAYSASVGWDAVTGLGSPKGTKILEDFKT